MKKFLESSQKPEVIYTDNSSEFGKSCEELSSNNRTAAPHRSETIGFAERAVRRVKEGTSAVPQSGLDEKWWADSMECFCYLRNVEDLMADGKTFYERRFGGPFKRPIMPFGAMVEYHPISTRGQSRLHQFGKKVLPGIFLEADIEELENLEASDIYPRRLNAKRSPDNSKRRRICISCSR